MLRDDVCYCYKTKPYQGYNAYWPEQYGMWWCNFTRTFEELEEETNIRNSNEDEERKIATIEELEKCREIHMAAYELNLSVDHEKLLMVRNECKEIIKSIHSKVDPSVEYYMEKNGINIDEDVKYFSWSESAS
jgi:hypothetical protein